MDNTIRTWDTVDQTEISCFDGPTHTEILCLDYLPKFGLIVTGHENGDLYMWDIDIGTKIKLGSKNKFWDNTICALDHMITHEFSYLFSAG